MPFDSKAHCAKHFRHLLKREGIKARCRAIPGSGNAIQIFPVAYGLEFDETTQRTIRTLATYNKLTCVRGLPIDIERMTDPHGMEFHL
jgi:hypothetical protein